MTDHPITPPPELLKALSHQFHNGESLEATWARAFQAGADIELDACCEWLKSKQTYWAHDELREARRPKPPSLKEQALEDLESLIADLANHGMGFKATNIRRALEALPDD